jgi:hypothetical protein
MNNIYVMGEWLKDFTDVTMISLKKKPYATKYTNLHSQPHHTYSKDSSKDT